MASIFRDLKSPLLIIDGTMDHVHILFSLARSIAIADLVEEVKTGSSKWIKVDSSLKCNRIFSRKGCGTSLINTWLQPGERGYASDSETVETVYPKSDGTPPPRNF